MKVCILISIPDTTYFDNCTLVFKTLRVGFPTAEVEVFINNVGLMSDRLRVEALARDADAHRVFYMDERVHHADWIKQRVAMCSDETLVILDGDVHFWASCEDWKFGMPLAGYHVPEIWNPWTNCRSLPRLHTSFLWFKVSEVKTLLALLMPENDVWAPNDPFMPCVQYIRGEPIFWDTCANLYAMIGGEPFSDEHTACFEHLNSAGFVEVVARKMGGKTGADFKMFHTLAPKDMHFVRTFGWPMLKKYYRAKQIEAQLRSSPLKNL